MSNPTASSRARAAAGIAAAPAATGGQLSPVDRRIADTRTMQSAFADAVASGLTPATLIRDAITAVRNVPKLAETEKGTFFGALMTAAQLGLRPNVGSLGHGWVLPFWSGRNQRLEAQWILGYQGMVELGYRSGIVKKITANTIFEGDEWEIERGLDEKLMHRPRMNAMADRGLPIVHYAVVDLTTGGQVWEAMGDDEVQAIMARSQTGSQGKGPWSTDYLPMARKSPLRAVWRWMPKTPDMALAIATDSVVREGLDKEAEVQREDETPDPVDVPESPQRETVTVTRQRAQEAREASEPPVDPPAAAEAASDVDVVDAEVVYEMLDGTTRKPAGQSTTRTAYIKRCETKHGARFVEAVLEVLGEAVPLEYLTAGELRAAAEVDLVVL